MLGRWRGYWFSGLRSDPCYHRQHSLQERNLLHFPIPLRELRGYHVDDALDTWCCEASFALRGPARHRLGMRLGGRQGCRCRNKCCVCLLSHARRMCDGTRDRIQVQLKGSHAPLRPRSPLGRPPRQPLEPSRGSPQRGVSWPRQARAAARRIARRDASRAWLRALLRAPSCCVHRGLLVSCLALLARAWSRALLGRSRRPRGR